MRLLVLEDDTTVLEVLRRDLSALGYVLSSAPSVQAAQVALRAETFDVAVLSERLLLDAELSLTDHIRASESNRQAAVCGLHLGEISEFPRLLCSVTKPQTALKRLAVEPIVINPKPKP